MALEASRLYFCGEILDQRKPFFLYPNVCTKPIGIWAFIKSWEKKFRRSTAVSLTIRPTLLRFGTRIERPISHFWGCGYFLSRPHFHGVIFGEKRQFQNLHLAIGHHQSTRLPKFIIFDLTIGPSSSLNKWTLLLLGDMLPIEFVPILIYFSFFLYKVWH